jgi:hypothetical protein
MGFFDKKTEKAEKDDFAEQRKVFEANFVVHDDDNDKKEYDQNDGIKGVDSIMDSVSTSIAVNTAVEIGAKTLVTGALTANAVYHGIQIAKTLKANEPLNPFNIVMAGVSTLGGIIEAKSTVDTIKTAYIIKKGLNAFN